MRHACHRAEPVWQPSRRLLKPRVPDKDLRWLLDPASLTRRVQSVCHGCFRVEVLFQGWGRPMRNEARELGMRFEHYGFIRQVYLLCDGTPWVFARTVIPPQTLTGRERRLAHLGARPLGAMLFADPGMARGEVEIARITPCDKLFAVATRRLDPPPPEIWGRRSVFSLSGKPLLVSEIFLPAIPPCRA